MSTAQSLNPSTSDFEAMLEASFETNSMTEGSVVKGLVTAVEKDTVVVDVGLKTEGRIPLREFYTPGSDEQIKVGDTVDIYLERIENALEMLFYRAIKPAAKKAGLRWRNSMRLKSLSKALLLVASKVDLRLT